MSHGQQGSGTVYDNYWQQRKEHLNAILDEAQEIARQWREDNRRSVREANIEIVEHGGVVSRLCSRIMQTTTHDIGRISPLTTPGGQIRSSSSKTSNIAIPSSATAHNSELNANKRQNFTPLRPEQNEEEANSRQIKREKTERMKAAAWKSKMSYTSEQLRRPQPFRSKTTPTDAPHRPLSVRYVPPPDRRERDGRPEELRIPPTPSPIEHAISQRPFLRYTDYLQSKQTKEKIPLYYKIPGRSGKTNATIAREREAHNTRLALQNRSAACPAWH